jgi:hypothetical protein
MIPFLLFLTGCNSDLNLELDTPNAKWKIAFDKQKELCEKYRAKLDRLTVMCSTEIPESFSHPNAPTTDPDFTEMQNNLKKICSVVMMAKQSQEEQEQKNKAPEKNTEKENTGKTEEAQETQSNPASTKP